MASISFTRERSPIAPIPIPGGRYADLFDHVEDTLTVQRFQVFDFEGAKIFDPGAGFIPPEMDV